MIGKIRLGSMELIVDVDLLRTDDLKEKIREIRKKHTLTKVKIEKVDGKYVFRYIDKNGMKQKLITRNETDFETYINHIQDYIPQMKLEDFKRLLKEEGVCAIVKPCDFNISL